MRPSAVMAIFFLELDDEITSAVARLRGSSEPAVALVLPAGSRIASSRINFRLLAREAAQSGARLAIVAPETTARALAIAAGLPAYASVREYEAALAEGPAGAEGTLDAAGEGTAAASGVTAGETKATAEAAAPLAGVAMAGTAPDAGSAQTAIEHPLRRFALPSLPRVSLPPSRAAPIVVAVLALALLGGGAAAGAYFVLPEALVTVTPRVEAFPPLTFEVTADPDATANDPAVGIVAADWLETTVEAQDTFRATGVKVTETKATGSVRFSNRDIDATQSIPGGSTVKTKSGVAFVTDKAVTVPEARVEQDPNGDLILVPGTANVAVTAADAGTDGNVAAGTITVVPRGYNPNLLRVTNPQPTSGGTHVETKIVRQSDYDSAVAALNAKLEASFAEWLDELASLLGETVVQRDSAELDAAEIDPPGSDVVGTETDTFAVGAQAAARVVFFDPTVLDSLGADRYRSSQVPSGYTLLEASVAVVSRQVESDDPTRPRWEVRATGQGYRNLDAAVLKAQILGKPLGEARALLGRHGDVTISLQPDWFGIVPSLDWRVTLEVAAPAAEAAAPSP